MTVVQQLYDLLGIDVEIEQFRKSIEAIDDNLADNHLIQQTRLAVEEAQVVLKKQETERKDLELTVESYQDKGKQLEIKLYGGTVRNPRELKDMQTELSLLREQQKQQEEILLLALEAVEETQQNLGGLESTLQEVQVTRRAEEKKLLKEKTYLKKDSAVLEEKRDGLSSMVSSEHMKLYDSLRLARQGRAIVKVERGICQGCRISLPTRVVQKARNLQNPIQCPSCSRILYAS